MRTGLLLLAVLLLGILGVYLYTNQPINLDTASEPVPTPTSSDQVIPATPSSGDQQTSIYITQPSPNQVIQSPLEIAGQARGIWYFEASFSADLEDAAGNLLGQAILTAQGDWMTENFVPFTGTLTFTQPDTATGTLRLVKANPSGLPEMAEERTIPVRFKD